jgi:dihydrodipicolinate synthase/N-acetylneuraminate lyase
MSWDEHDRVDEDVYIANTRRVLASGVHGVYTTGSTGEFYALDFDEFRRMVDIQAELCGAAAMPLQIGCCADATRKTLRMLEYVAAKPAVGAAQVTLPYWMAVSDRELLSFFRDLHAACPDLPLVHYNIPRAKRFLVGPDYQRLLEVAPNLIGVKFCFAEQHFAQLQEAIGLTPQVSYLVAEPTLVDAMKVGARGCFSSLSMMNPALMLRMYDAARSGDWKAAAASQARVTEFFSACESFVEALGEGAVDPVIDKAFAIASGFLRGSQRCRAPYIAWSDESVRRAREWLSANHPEFVANS